MIHELSGDILLSGAKAIAHGVTPNDDFHHGLALQLRERMPALYYVTYQKGMKANEPK